jgi:exonuclease III
MRRCRIAAWNVCGIKACDKKVHRLGGSDGSEADGLEQGLKTYVEAEDADILVLTETKSGEPGIAELSERYPVSWSVFRPF